VGSGQLGRFEERPLGSRTVARLRLGVPHPEQEVASSGGILPGRQLEDLDPEAVQPHGLLVGDAVGSRLGRPASVLDRLGPVATRGGLDEMMGQLCEVRLNGRPVQAFENLAGPAMELEPPGRRDLLVQRVTDQGVAESQPSQGTGNVRDHAGRRRLVEQAQEVAG
jgi:hypothetical protein